MSCACFEGGKRLWETGLDAQSFGGGCVSQSLFPSVSQMFPRLFPRCFSDVSQRVFLPGQPNRPLSHLGRRYCGRNPSASPERSARRRQGAPESFARTQEAPRRRARETRREDDNCGVSKGRPLTWPGRSSERGPSCSRRTRTEAGKGSRSSSEAD